MLGKKVGIYSGSFNPVHIGHLALANYLCEHQSLDEVWFLLTPQNPLKEAEADYSEGLRLKWLREATQDYPKFKVSDFETTLPKPTYTISTLRALQNHYPQHQFTLIIGADNWSLFDKWKDYTAILDEFTVLVYPRKGYNLNTLSSHPSVKLVNDAPLIEVSSTAIRLSLQQGKDLRFFVPACVYADLISLHTRCQ